MSTSERASEPGSHDWGDAPELYGPRHDYREALVLRRLLPALPGPRVLNAGAGAGTLTLRLVDAGLTVTSVDASAALCGWLERALRERGAAAGNPVVRGDVARLDLPDAAFDAAVCAEVLEHVDDDAAALAELRARAAPRRAAARHRARPTPTATTGPTAGPGTAAATTPATWPPASGRRASTGSTCAAGASR